ncbi:MAG: hypothetical protein OXF57_00655 [Rhodospirillaceae bacterium]|nr:hypothetical protein [Rhodospirillaceae bacterium]
MNNLLTRDEIIALIEEIRLLDRSELEGKEFEKRSNELYDTLMKGVLDPSIPSYIYWEIPSLTPEQIADRALSYKPIILPDQSGR